MESTFWNALRSTDIPRMRRKLASSLFSSLALHLPTLHSLASSDLHCGMHLYLTNRYLITRTAILPSCYDIDTAMTTAMQFLLQGVYRVYTDKKQHESSILPVFNDKIIDICDRRVKISGSLSPQHGSSSGCGWRNGFQHGG